VNHHSSPTHTTGELTPAAAALASITQTYSGLPTPYVSITPRGRINLQLTSPAAFEAWRTALMIPEATVQLHQGNGSSWLAGETVHAGVVVELSGHGLMAVAA